MICVCGYSWTSSTLFLLEILTSLELLRAMQKDAFATLASLFKSSDWMTSEGWRLLPVVENIMVEFMVFFSLWIQIANEPSTLFYCRYDNLCFYCKVKDSTQQIHMSQRMTKPNKWHVRPAKTQISLGIRPVWSEYSLCAQWTSQDPSFLHADSKDSDLGGWPYWSESLLGAHAIL